MPESYGVERGGIAEVSYSLPPACHEQPSSPQQPTMVDRRLLPIYPWPPFWGIE